MNIIFFCSLNPYDINNWSGTTWHILKTLEKKHHVIVIGTHMLSQTAYFAMKNFPKNNAHGEYSLLFGKLCSELINRVPNCDLVFFGDLQLSPYLEINIPIVHLSDVNYHLFKDYVPKKRTKEQDKATEKKEKNLLYDKYTTIIYCSEWAKENTVDYYGINPEKIHVVELGANIPHPLDYQAEIQTDVCNLVFIGRNWEKKGGDKVIGAYKKLKSEGFPCTCTLIGSVPPNFSNNDHFSQNEDSNLTIIPFLDKSNPEQLKRLCNILKTAHFLVLPTEFDAFGIVFCEASAYGVPSIAANVGGVSQPVREGKNGFLLPPDATAEDYAEKIKNIFSDKKGYLTLRKSSRHEYETRLNWDVWGEKVNRIFEETVRKHKEKKEQQDAKNNFYLPVYVINLKERTDRRQHIEAQFHGKPEFALTWIDAVEHPIGAVGLWKSMVKAVETAIENDDDIMIICEDDHTFTPAYSIEYLLANIVGANEQGAELLSGGIGGFGSAVPVANNRYWVDWFWCTQFIVVFKPLFQKIIDYDFKDTDTADGVLSTLAKDKMTMYPFVSIQTDFGYSDVTHANDEISGTITNHFRNADYRLNVIHHVAHKFRKNK